MFYYSQNFIALLNSLYYYMLDSKFFFLISRIYNLSEFFYNLSDLLRAFTCASTIDNLWSIFLRLNIMSLFLIIWFVWSLKYNLITATRDSYSNLIVLIQLFCSSDLYFPHGISFTFDLNIFCSLFASSSFILPYFVFSKSFIPSLKSSSLFLALSALK